MVRVGTDGTARSSPRSREYRVSVLLHWAKFWSLTPIKKWPVSFHSEAWDVQKPNCWVTLGSWTGTNGYTGIDKNFYTLRKKGYPDTQTRTNEQIHRRKQEQIHGLRQECIYKCRQEWIQAYIPERKNGYTDTETRTVTQTCRKKNLHEYMYRQERIHRRVDRHESM
jgi:hypothetical protein